MCWSSSPVVTSSLFLHAGLALYWITFGLVSPAAAVKLGLGFVGPLSWVVTATLHVWLTCCQAAADELVWPDAGL